MKRTKLLVFLPLCVLLKQAYCQDINHDYYKYGAGAAVIPAALQQFESRDRKFVFGISDPGLDTVTAINQARQRAYVLSALMSGVRVNNYFSGFLLENNTHNSGTFESMNELILDNVKLQGCIVTDTAFTSYSEAIVFADVTDNYNDTLFNLSINRYNVEYEYGGYKEYGEQLEYLVSDKLFGDEKITSIRFGSVETVFTYRDDQTFYFPVTRYQYISDHDTVPQFFRFGLWLNFVRELNNKLSQISREHLEQVRNLNQQHHLNESLNEGVSTTYQRFEIIRLSFINSAVELDLRCEFYD